ncbi:MAG: PIG-L family deacetylase [Verrucomicrobiota bacterium]
MNPYLSYVSSFIRLVSEGKSLPLGNIPPCQRTATRPGAPVALIFSPHPDDECIIGGLALRLMRESGFRVINIAVTQGSNQERQQPRLTELLNACNWIGFELEQTAPNGLEKITPKTRNADPAHWVAAVNVIAGTLSRLQPRVILYPHELDWNGTHIGTHHLVMDALKTLPVDFRCHLVETEFWGQMMSPNLLVELSAKDLADLLAALSYHVGEVLRNPYHLRLPAWMQDNVRRGAELVGGQGGAAPDYQFGTLYRVLKWTRGRVEPAYTGGKQISASDNPGTLFA